jgi:hypothetical protein
MAMIEANWNGSRSLEAVEFTNAQAQTAVIIIAHAGALKRLSRTVRVFMRRSLLREVVQKLLAEENDRCEGDRRTENKSSDDVEQFQLNPLTRALSSKDN